MFSQVLSEQNSFRILQSIVVATPNLENAIVLVSNAPQGAQIAKTMINQFFNPRSNHQNMKYSGASFDIPLV